MVATLSSLSRRERAGTTHMRGRTEGRRVGLHQGISWRLRLRTCRSFAKRIEQLAIARRRAAAIARIAQVALIVVDFAAGPASVRRIAQRQALERLVPLALPLRRLLG